MTPHYFPFLNLTKFEQLSRKWTHNITTILFFAFGLWSLWEGFTEDGDGDELAEVEAKLDADSKADKNGAKGGPKAEDLKKQQRPFLTQFFSPILLKAFSITFFGEWGDRSQIATIGLASDEDPFGVILGGILYVFLFCYSIISWWEELGIPDI